MDKTMKPWHAMTCFIALLLASGCLTPDTTNTATTSTKPTSTTHDTVKTTTTTPKPEATTMTVKETTTTTIDDGTQWVHAPKEGCECVQWVCDTPTTTTSSTSTTCVTIPVKDYTPQARQFHMRIKGQEFRPDEIEVFVGDTVIANITNVKGLHRIRETYTNKSITLQSGESYELIFYAEEAGEYQLTCNPYCEEPMEAKILVREAYVKRC
ncbi:MAG: hypothetical protein GF416_02805 [Candidatus Altiarchaeales archaeon]|nr:hypothetical protein [Candidatus Altiarchaeales archaeon]MBD3416049.1 hypothetical protein [Candidatus Altiarchaeales archaeon]